MLFELVKRDPAWKIAIGLAIAAIVAMPVTRLQHSYAVLGMILPLFFLAANFARPQQRLTMFEAALPISSRDIYLSRSLALLAIAWLPAVTAILMAYALGSPEWPAGLLECGALMSVLLLLLLSLRMPAFDSPKWMSGAIWGAGIVVGATGIRFLPAAILVPAYLAIAAAIFLRTWASIPPTFQIAPLELEPQRERSAIRRVPPPPWWIFLKSSLPSWWSLFSLLLVMIAVIMQLRLGSWLFACWFASLLYLQARVRTPWVEALPVSRRALLLIALAPTVLPMVTGAAISTGEAQVSRAQVSMHSVVDYEDLNVPLEFWHHAPGGVAPAVESPWGETYKPDVVTFLRYPVYNPYSVGRDSSARFIEWQYKRARDLANRPELTGARFRILYVAAIFAISLIFAWRLEVQYWFRFTRLSRSVRTAWGVAVLGPLFLLLIFDRSHPGGGSEPATTALLRGFLLRVAERLPGGLVAPVLAGAVPVILMLWLVDWQFRQSELKPRR